MLVRYGDHVGTGHDAIPKRLYKIDTFFDGKLIEPERRRKDCFGHMRPPTSQI